MNGGTLFWLIVGGISGALFFGIALVVAIRGIRELRELLVRGDRRNGPGQ